MGPQRRDPDEEALGFRGALGEGLILEVPQTRDDYVDLLPAIFVATPAWGEPVASPVSVSGVANVFEATFRLLVTDDGAPLNGGGFVTASCGPGAGGLGRRGVRARPGPVRCGDGVARVPRDGSHRDLT